MFSATKQMRECKVTDAEKLLSQWEKVAYCYLWIKLKYMKDVSFSWNEMLFSIQRITNLELLRTLMLGLVQLSKLRECKATDAEKLLSQWEKVAKCNFTSNALARPRIAEKLLSQWVKLLTAIIRVKYMKDVFSHEMKCYLQCRR